MVCHPTRRAALNHWSSVHVRVEYEGPGRYRLGPDDVVALQPPLPRAAMVLCSAQLRPAARGHDVRNRGGGI
jgi:hypothetical protein